jgi:hypothetical protein
MPKSKLTHAPAALVLAFSLIAPVSARAKPEFFEEFRAEYPWVVGTRLDTCNVCHTSVPRRNPYGTDFNLAGRQFSVIEPFDSDDDGADNLTEIMALTFPGDASDVPGAPATSTATPIPSHTPVPTATTGPAACDGDCNGDGVVTINEVILAVNIGLGTIAVEECPAADANGDGQVTINELVRAVNLGLTGCPPA